MTTISIFPESPGVPTSGFRAVAGTKQAIGKTAGEALDALTSQLDESETGTLLVVQPLQPDRYFTAQQQLRVLELMKRWRQARDSGSSLPADEQAELDSLVEAEVRAAAERAAGRLAINSAVQLQARRQWIQFSLFP